MTVGEKIKSIRKQNRISQQELGNMLGVSQAMIAQYENGKRIPKIETLIKIAEALECEVSDIDENITVHRHTVKLEPTPEDIERYKKNAEAEELIQKKASGQNITEDEQKKIDDCIERKKEVLPRLRESLEKFSDVVDAWGENVLIDRYRRLNSDGKNEAIKRIDELTEIPRYINPTTPPQE